MLFDIIPKASVSYHCPSMPVNTGGAVTALNRN
jgi:hypothetical protein